MSKLCLTALLLINVASHSVSADTVKPSSNISLLFGQTIDEFDALSNKGEVILQRLTERTYWIHVNGYSSIFYVGNKGVALFDPLSGGRGKEILKSIKTITDLPVTALIYSHSHLDHIGDAQVVVDELKTIDITPRIIATTYTNKEIQRFRLNLPSPTELIDVPRGEFYFENLKVQIFTLENFSHSLDSSVFYLTSESVVHGVDGINPGYLPYFKFSGAMDPQAFTDMIKLLLSLDWNFLNGGHGNIGSRQDARLYLDYMLDIGRAVKIVLATLDYAEFYNAETHGYEGFVRMIAEIAQQVSEKLSEKYGDYLGFNHVIKSHVEAMNRQIVVHGAIQ